MKFCTLLLCCCSVAVVTAKNGPNGQQTGSRKIMMQNQSNPSKNNGNIGNSQVFVPDQNQDENHQNAPTVKFSAGLFEAVKGSQPQNFVLSPLSLRNALAMVSLGAAGETAREIREALQFPNSTIDLVKGQSQLIKCLKGISSGNSGVQFVTADIIYANSKLNVKEQFQKDVRQLEGEIDNVDFSKNEEAATKINEWVKNKTAGKVENLVEPSALNSQTSLLVLNTIYFKGSWKSPFFKSSTSKRPFFIEGNQSVSVQMMTQENEFQFADLKEPDSKVIILPYKGKRLSMMIYVPRGNEDSSLSRLETWLKDQSPFEIQKEHLFQNETVSIFLPKFKIRSSFQLNEPLKSLGLKNMFDANSANFSGIFNGPENFFVSKVSQETFIEVNEQGTEAAAATGVQLGATSFSPTPQFKVDRPFVFQIVDVMTKTILFTGRVKDPREAQDPTESSSPVPDYPEEGSDSSAMNESNEDEEPTASCDQSQNVGEILEKLLSLSNSTSSKHIKISVSCLKHLAGKWEEEKAKFDKLNQTLQHPQEQGEIMRPIKDSVQKPETEAKTQVITRTSTSTSRENTPEPEENRHQGQQAPAQNSHMSLPTLLTSDQVNGQTY